MRWWWPWIPRQADSKTATDSGAQCEICGAYAIIFLNGQRLLCWDHYRDALAAVEKKPTND
jgi:hypothetical protein